MSSLTGPGRKKQRGRQLDCFVLPILYTSGPLPHPRFRCHTGREPYHEPRSESQASTMRVARFTENPTAHRSRPDGILLGIWGCGWNASGM